MKIYIIDYKAGNLHSVYKAIQVCGYKNVEIIDKYSKRKLDECKLVILPGVGHFKSAIYNLKKYNFFDFIKKWLEDNKPFLGVCLGLQLLFEYSEEGDSKGLGVLPGKVVKLTDVEKVPHMGWNNIYINENNFYDFKEFNNEFFYFVHSYCVELEDKNLVLAHTEYDNKQIICAVAKKNLIAVQFHPEKSQKLGLNFLKRSIHYLLKNGDGSYF